MQKGRFTVVEKTKRVTLAQVAAASGFSITAVSSILNNDPKYKVSPESRRKVQDVAAQLNYKPNPAARALITRRHRAIGLLVYSIQDRCYSEIAAAAQRELATRGYASLFAFWGDSDFRSAFNLLLDHGVDGIITSAPEESFDGFDVNIPVVLYGCRSERHDAVLVERGKALWDVMQYLYDNNHRHFAYLCNGEPEPRYQAFLDFLHAHHLPVNPEWIMPTSNEMSSRLEGMRRILDAESLPSVVIAQNDISALAAMALATERGIKVPDEMSFVGFDNICESRYAIPALTTLDIRIDETAAALVDILLRRIEQPDLPVMTRRIEPRMVIRQSCKERFHPSSKHKTGEQEK